MESRMWIDGHIIAPLEDHQQVVKHEYVLKLEGISPTHSRVIQQSIPGNFRVSQNKLPLPNESTMSSCTCFSVSFFHGASFIARGENGYFQMTSQSRLV